MNVAKTNAIKTSGKEISAGLDLTGNLQAAITGHNNDASSHEIILMELAKKANTSSVNENLMLKAEASTTYTKTETDAALSLKLNGSDTTVTKQGNEFNGANQLVQLNSSGKLPAFDGSLLTNTSLNNIEVTAANNLNTAGIRTVVSADVNGTSWYRVWSDGWIEQGGMVSYAGNIVSVTTTFLKPFSNANYTITTSDHWGTYNGTYSHSPITAKSSTYFTTVTMDNFYTNWQACGY